MTDMNLPFPLDWREIIRLPDNTRICLFIQHDRFNVVRFNPDNTWKTPTSYADEATARDCYANAIAIARM